MALALDPADDPEGKLAAVLRQATGAWLYVADDLLRTDARGGFAPDSLEDLPRTTGALAQLLLALHTAGRADPAALGPQVVAFFHVVAEAIGTLVDGLCLLLVIGGLSSLAVRLAPAATAQTQ